MCFMYVVFVLWHLFAGTVRTVFWVSTHLLCPIVFIKSYVIRTMCDLCSQWFMQTCSRARGVKLIDWGYTFRIFECGSYELLRHLEARTIKPLWFWVYVVFCFLPTCMHAPLFGTLFGKSLYVCMFEYVILGCIKHEIHVCLGVGTTLIYHICCCCNTYVYANII